MDANCINALDLKSCTLQAIDNETERGGCIGAREDVLVHEETPDEVLVLPGLPQASVLQVENAIIVQHVVDLRQKGAEVPDADVFCHFQACDFLVASWDGRCIAIISAQNPGLRFWNVGIAKALVTPGCLVTTKSDTSDVSTIVDRSVLGKSAPAATKIKNSISLLETDFLANNCKLVILELLESLLLVDIRDETGSIDHAWAKEP